MKRGAWARTLCAAALACCVFQPAQPAKACGPFFEEALFTFREHPDLPLAPFAAGDLGILQSSYARSYLAVAYRYLMDRPLDPLARQEVDALWRERRSMGGQPLVESSPWLVRRARVARPPGLPGLTADSDFFRSVPGLPYSQYVNCTTDAFRRAATTVEELGAAYGASSAVVSDWVAAQDMVFANCGQGNQSPPLSPAGTPRELAALRAYQVAAAHFYSERFVEAESEFRAIAADSASPQRTIAPYLVARTLIRRATLTGPADSFDRAVLARAKAELDTILASPDLSAIHGPTAALRGFVLARLEPEQRLREMAHEILTPDPGAGYKQNLTDYTWMLDRIAVRKPNVSGDIIPESARSDDLTDWIGTFQSVDQPSADHAVERWRTLRTAPWLIAAISKVRAGDPAASELAAAADGIGWGTPGSVSLAYHAVRLRIEQGALSDARAFLDAIVAQRLASLPRSARNQFLGLRLRLADSLGDLLRFAQRSPAGATSADGGEEQPVDAPDTRVAKLPGIRAFDSDGAAVLNARLPLARLAGAAVDRTLPENLQRGVALAAWTRAVMLRQPEIARTLAPIVGALVPAMRADLVEYAGLDEAHGQALAGLTIVLRNPGTRPFITPGLERETRVNRLDPYRDNWWCAPAEPEPDPVGFLGEAERLAASSERSQLTAIGEARNHLAREAVRLATLFPNDPKAPEVLHLAVQATRYGCGAAPTGPASQAAFALLHSKYPNSTWAKQTPFWFDR